MAMKLWRLVRLAPLALLVAGNALAQNTSSITGVVTDASTGKPVVGAVVVVTSPAAEGEQTVVTEAGGKFTVPNLPAGDYTLAVQMDGYKPFERSDLKLKEATTLRANAQVVPESVQMEEVVVTGSRIRRKDLTTPAPVTVVNREQIADSGKVSIGDFLQTLPEQGGGTNAQVNNGGDGSVNIDLRNLGANRTLVLLNGRRFVNSNSGSGEVFAVDLNSIPSGAVERIEILKDGGSAIYGSDAIAGVVNIITRKRFDGAEASAYTGQSSRHDGTVYDLNLTVGSANDKGGVMITGGFYQQKAIMNGDRKWGQVLNGFDYSVNEPYPILSSRVPAGAFSLDPRTCNTPACLALQSVATQNGVDYSGGAPLWVVDPTAPGGAHLFDYMGDGYNFQPTNYLSTPMQRISVFATADRKLGDWVRAYSEFSFTNRQSKTNGAPEPLDMTLSHQTISKNNLYNPYGVDVVGYKRRMVEYGPRIYGSDVDTFRVLGGLDGTLPEAAGPLAGWFWDVNFNYGRNAGVSTTDGTLRTDRLGQATGPSKIDPVSGRPVCVDSGGATIPGCTPVDMFAGAGNLDPSTAGELRFLGIDKYYWSLASFQVNANGELFKLAAQRPVSLAIGYEFRREAGRFDPNPIAAAGQGSGNNFVGTQGSYHVNEWYGELSIPLLSDKPLVEQLEATAAIRAFNYSTFGSDATYKLGLRYSPVRDITLRGTYSTAFRAPNIVELYEGGTDSFPSVTDPCSTYWGTPPASCAGVVNNDENQQLLEKWKGNAKLKPETAKIFTAGLVYEPRQVQGLSFTVDYYMIDLKKYITRVGADSILNGCYNLGIQSYCDMIHRFDKKVDYIDDPNTNVGGVKTAGLDFAGRYDLRSPIGRFNFVADVTWLQKYDQTQPDGTVIKAKGNYDLALVLPAWKANASVLWGLGNFGATVDTRYVGSYKECGVLGGFYEGGFCSLEHSGERTVRAYNIWDVSGSYSLGTGFGQTHLVVGVQNLFDTEPPKVYANGFQPSDETAYDFLGRYYFVKLTHKI